MPPNFIHMIPCRITENKTINNPPANKPPNPIKSLLFCGWNISKTSCRRFVRSHRRVPLLRALPRRGGNTQWESRTRCCCPLGSLGTVVGVQIVDTRQVVQRGVFPCVANLGTQRSLTESKCVSFASKLGRRRWTNSKGLPHQKHLGRRSRIAYFSCECRLSTLASWQANGSTTLCIMR